jgi:hypothetical protein
VCTQRESIRFIKSSCRDKTDWTVHCGRFEEKKENYINTCVYKHCEMLLYLKQKEVIGYIDWMSNLNASENNVLNL